MSRQTSCNHSRINPRRLLAGLLAAGLSVSAFAQSVQFPTYTPGENQSGTRGPDYPSSLLYPWVVSDGTIITPAGTQVYLGTTTRAKAVALNPNTSTHTAAVLQMGAPQAVTIFNTQTGAVLQNVKYGTSRTGSATGIVYTSDGLHLLFSQDNGFVAYVNVDPGTGKVTTDIAQISLPLDATMRQLPRIWCYGTGAEHRQLHSDRHHAGNQRSDLRPCGNLGQLCGSLRRSRSPVPVPIHWASRSRLITRPPTSCWTPAMSWARST